MPSAPLLTVVVPAFGVQEWLDECLASALEQDFGAGLERAGGLEVIVVVDASPDRSAEVAREWSRSDPRLVVVHNDTNLGLGASRNVGLDRARGRYVAFVDSDDVVSPGAFAAAVDTLERTGSDLATAPADEFGRGPGRARYWTTRQPVYETVAERTTLVEHPELVWDHTAWTKVFRREFLVTSGVRWAEGTTCEDVAASTLAYARAEAVDVLPGCGYLYRRRSGSLSSGLVTRQAVHDWAVQTRAALHVLRSAGDAGDAAAGELARKVLLVELVARCRAVADDAGPSRAALRVLLDELLPAAGPAVLDEAPVEVLAAALGAVERDSAAGRALVRALVGGVAPPGDRLPETASPTISVVVPTRDVAAWIDECLDSVLEQDVDLEVVVVDDASTDGTWSAVRARASRDPRVVVLRNPGRGGGQARNAGVAAARGTYLVFCDGDDVVPRGAYATLLATMRDTQAEMVVGGYQRVASDSVWRATGYGFDEPSGAMTLRLRPALVRGRTCWNRMFRRDWWDARRLRFPSVPRANDIFPMTAAMVRASRIAVVPDVVYQYRARPGGTSMTAKAGAWRSLVGYLAQERLCAVEVSRPDDDRTTREYWSMVLEADCWAAVAAFLSGDVATLTEQARDAVRDALGALLDLAPGPAMQAAGARRRAVYALTAAGRFAEAAVLVAPPGTSPDVQEASRRLTVIAALPDSADVPSVCEDLVRSDVLGVLLAAPEVSAGVASQLAEELRTAQITGAGTPGTREPRLLAALLTGDEEDVRREAHAGRPETTVRVTEVEGRSVRLTGGGLPGALVHHVELVGRRPGPASDVRWRAVGAVQQHESGWSARLDLDDVPAGVDWAVRPVVLDRFGAQSTAGRLRWDAPRSRAALVRPTTDTDGALRLRVFASGATRVARAVEWRLERVRRRFAGGTR